jgi:hypothetical protein
MRTGGDEVPEMGGHASLWRGGAGSGGPASWGWHSKPRRAPEVKHPWRARARL